MTTTETPPSAPVKYGWTWYLPEDDPDESGTAWIEIGPLDESGCLSGEHMCEIICRNYTEVLHEHPEWVEQMNKDAQKIVDALNKMEAAS